MARYWLLRKRQCYFLSGMSNEHVQPTSSKLMRKFGFTLVELLVVTAIVAILLAIAVPVFVMAKKEAFKAEDISHLRQLGVSRELYMGDYDAEPWLGIVSLVSGGYSSPRICGSQLDSFAPGYANIVRPNIKRRRPPREIPVSPYRVSYLSREDLGVKTSGDRNVGWLVALHSYPGRPSSRGAGITQLAGRISRLTLDGGVIERDIFSYHVVLPNGREYTGLKLNSLFQDGEWKIPQF